MGLKLEESTLIKKATEKYLIIFTKYSSKKIELEADWDTYIMKRYERYRYKLL